MAINYITELHYDGAWRDITPDVRNEAPIAMSRGRKDWASAVSPSTCKFVLNNGVSKASAGVLGRYSPRNPLSDLYGKIGRNTPVRVRIDGTRQNDSIILPGVLSSFVSAPDSADFSGITGDIDLRIDMRLNTWQPLDGVFRFLVARADINVASGFSWILSLKDTGVPNLQWSTDGGLGGGWSSIPATEAIPADIGRTVLRAILDVDNGVGNHVVTFFTGPDIDAPDGPDWTQLGSQIVTGGTTSIFNSDADATIGGITDGAVIFSEDGPLDGEVFAVQIRDGLQGPVVGGPDFSGHEPEDRSFEDPEGNTWTLHGSATFHDDSIRFAGEATAWPVRWPLSGAEAGGVAFTASGILRRLQRGTKPLKSSLFRDLSVNPSVVAYWPLEEPEGASRFTSGLPGDTSALIPSNPSEITFAGDDTLVSSAPLPVFNASYAYGAVPTYSGGDDQRFIVFIKFLDESFTSEKLIIRLRTSGTAARWDIRHTTIGGLRLIAVDEDGNTIEDQSMANDFRGHSAMISLLLRQEGSDIDWELSGFRLGETSQQTTGNIILGETYGWFTTATVGSSTDVEGITYGHAAIINDDVAAIWGVVTESLLAWAGETGVDRLIRLGADEGLPAVRVDGSSGDAETMGPQRRLRLVELFREVPAADLGIFGDRHDAVGLRYRPRMELYNQTPALVLDYSHGVIAEPFVPVDDDQATRNQITVNQVRGSSYTAVAKTGPMSVQDPPDGVGVYDYSTEVNIDSGVRVPVQADWRLHLGTIDEARWPTVRLNLRNQRVAAMADDIMAVTEGDLIRIVNLPEQVPPGPVDLFVEGMTEEKTADTHFIEFNCSPGSAWDVFILDDDVLGRLDTGGSELAASVDETTTELIVATDSGKRRWIIIDRGLILSGEVGSHASTPDDPILRITGDIDLRAVVALDDYSNGANQTVLAKYNTVGDQRSYALRVDPTGFPAFLGSPDGALPSIVGTADADLYSAGVADGQLIALRVTRNAATGVITHYLGDEPSVAPSGWTQLGSPLTRDSGNLHSGTALLEVGSLSDGTADLAAGLIRHGQVRSGIHGTIVADVDFADQPTDTTSFVDDTGLAWTIHPGASLGPEDTFEIEAGGETMLVEGITGSFSPQTFRVIRSRNRIRKAHAAGTRVQLASKHVISL